MTQVEEIKSRLNLLEIVQGYVRLQKAGTNFKANCPFHSEATASFFVSPSKQIWHCFGCGLGGDVFKFVMEIEGQGFPEVLRLLAERAGVELRKEDPNIRTEQNRLYAVADAALEFFQSAFRASPEAKAYLEKRGVRPDTIQEFRVGFAPPQWDSLTRALKGKGFREDDMTHAGLAIRSSERNSYYDRFRGRIMFPISDAVGRVIGFGGRLLKPDPNRPDEAKYINTPQTAIYDKSRVLYGFEHAKQEIRKANAVVIVEGYMDCVMSHQGGVRNVVAVSGTALTPPQLTTLKRLCGTVIMSFDTDRAGENATRRSLTLAAAHGFERKIAAIPSGKDPADAVKDDPERWVHAVATAEPIVQHFFQKAFRTHSAESPEGKKAIAAMLFPYIAEIADAIERAHWVGEIARAYGIREDHVWSDLAKYQRSDDDVPPVEVPKEPARNLRVLPRREMLEERFLALFLLAPADVKTAVKETSHLTFASAVHQEIHRHAIHHKTDRALSDTAREETRLLQLKGEILAHEIKDLGSELSITLRELERCNIKESLDRMSDEIHVREQTGTHAELASLLQNFRELTSRLQQLS